MTPEKDGQEAGARNHDATNCGANEHIGYSIGASLLWFWLLKRGEASVVSPYYFLTPIAGLALAALLLGEPFGGRDLLGLGAVATGIALISYSIPDLSNMR